MNNEIKEIKHILELLHFECNPKAREEDINKILDYITNLEEEKETRQYDINNLTYQLAKEKSRIDKAIDYINNCIGIEVKEELRSILQGEDKE